MKISALQFSPGSNKLANIRVVDSLITEVVRADNPDLVVLPEVWTCLGGTPEQKLEASETIPETGSSEGGGPAIQFLRIIAKAHKIFIHCGSIIEFSNDRFLNTSVVISPNGTIVGRYSKLHLFDITTPSGQDYRESDTYRGGQQVVTLPIKGVFGEARLGLAICYDLRFSELFLELRKQGSDIITLPAAFTSETGIAHWEILVRARAIETQCWLVAAGTVGPHIGSQGDTRMTFGHSMIVDPWGKVVAQIATKQGFITAAINHSLTTRIRTEMPVIAHRRLK